MSCMIKDFSSMWIEARHCHQVQLILIPCVYFQILIFNFYLSKHWLNLKLLIKMISIKDLAHCTLHEKLTLLEISTSKIRLKKKSSWTRNHLWRHAFSWQSASGSGFYVGKFQVKPIHTAQHVQLRWPCLQRQRYCEGNNIVFRFIIEYSSLRDFGT